MISKLCYAAVLVLATFAATACSDPGLGEAGQANVEDTVVLGALTGSALTLPSGFSIPEGLTVRTDLSSGFDFVYEILPGNRRVLMPLAAIGMSISGGTNPALLKSGQTFESIVVAPTSGYSTTDTLTIGVGDVVVGRSRVVCYLSVPQYAKFKVVSFDDAAKTVQLQLLAGVNCGYRNLQPGFPVD